MMPSFFLVIEGLDGSGKTYLSRAVRQTLARTLGERVALTFEPHDPSSAGIYIRQVLTKRLKNVHPRTLALAFALNRADHNDRVIGPFLAHEGRILICDRYYLSSIVYQSLPPLTVDDVRALNRGARRPDLTIFLDASPQVCYERMSKRPEDRELFEENLGRTRQKYHDAIGLLRRDGENVVVVNADGTFDEVLQATLDVLTQHGPDWLTIPSPLDDNGKTPETDDIFPLFLRYLEAQGFRIGERLPWTEVNACALEYPLPLGMVQRGAALVLAETQGYDLVTRRVLGELDRAESDVERLCDFMVVFDAAPSRHVEDYARDAAGPRLSPAVRVVRRAELEAFAAGFTDAR